MTKSSDDATHYSDRQDPGIKTDVHAAGGWGSVKEIAAMLKDTPVSLKAAEVLYRLNKNGGVMCSSCAWAKPKEPHTLEICEAGIRATLWELDERRAGPDFFADHTLAELRTWSDHELEASGRLTHPMRYDADSDRYLPVSWDDATAAIARAFKAMDPEEVVFYASGHAGIEASFLYALFARAMGHQNLPQSSNMCHETTSVNLKNLIGTPVGTCVLEDFQECDTILFFGQNTGMNSPRFLRDLEKAVKNGCRIITFNPLRESGSLEFVDPQRPLQMLTNKGTKLSEELLQVRSGGDVAVLCGLMKCVLAAERAAPGTVLDQDFIDANTIGFDDAIAAVDAFGWDEIEQVSGLTRAQIENVGDIYLASKRCIAIYGMGLTQHVGGWLNLGMLVNLLLMRGHFGKPGTGISPVRGHSNVQGQRTVGIGEKSSHMPADKLKEYFDIDAPTKDGLNAGDACDALLAGRVKAMVQLGGNLVRALPDRERMEAAWPSLDLSLNISTKLNRSHLAPGKETYILPCLSRVDADIHDGKPRTITIEDSLSHIHASTGEAEPASTELRSEVEIVAALAEATLPPHPKRPWSEWAKDYGLIRDAVARTFPYDFADFNDRLSEPGGFYRRNPVRDLVWKTDSGKASFTTPTTLSALAEAPGEGVFTLVTLRAQGQFNTTVYSYSDQLRGLGGARDIVLLNREEMERHNLTEGQKITLVCAIDDGHDRRVSDLKVIPYDMPMGCIGGYFPELNALVPLSLYEKNSRTPAYKGTPVRIEP